ncbi:Na+/H+ antiporter NhaC [Bacillus sp. B15-48]|uniref:Na+/H+ antiporter NhaC n=1 Tax=Bacillus sp. B15-48 TaxID=1548601 RepID=UPI00193F0B66|nr:Na+/H+ antiporter NhaC [Bacillus sp. B15-48]MBM4764307.1 Na+/H+ antiporter NhaC [Bacillus sp. B15-48]
MLNQKAILNIRPVEALTITIILLTAISFSIIKLQLVPHVPVMIAIFLLILYGLIKKVKVADLEAALMDGAKSGLGAVIIFFLIGMLISSWMASGTIPTFIFLAFELISGKWFYAIVFVVTAIIGLGIGSSLTTAATIGSAFMGVSVAFDLSLAITAGAVVSGAFFGDKMSPLSDTTTLASSTVNVDLFEHIKNMAWTTVPAFILSLLLFMILSPGETGANFDNAAVVKQELVKLNLVHWYSLIPFFVLAIFAIKKIPAFITLGAGTVTAMVISLFITEKAAWAGLLTSLYSGYTTETQIAEVASLLSRGGIESMLFSISLVLLALAMGGLLFRLGILQALLSGIEKSVKKVSVLISSTVASSIGINFLLGEQYLSIILTGTMFEPHYRQAGLHPKNLSRALEDAGTVINPLVPWSVCGVFLAGVLGVPTFEYAVFAFFCLISPLLTILAGLTKISITKLEKKAAA